MEKKKNDLHAELADANIETREIRLASENAENKIYYFSFAASIFCNCTRLLLKIHGKSV